VGRTEAEALHPFRGQVDRGEMAFSGLVAEHGLALAGDVLVHFGHWITPDFMPKRFDTHFFLAAAPDSQIAEQDGRETTEAIWVSPRRALELEKAGEATIIFPTRMNLGRLALETSVEGALARFAREPVVTVLPEVVRQADGPAYLRIPHVEGYGQVHEPLERVADVAKPGSGSGQA